MSRVINTDGPGKRRNQLMRTCAELLRRLSQKQDIDSDSKDMLALLTYCLREIESGIDESALAWEKRDYWMKAEEFRQRWRWAGTLAGELEGLMKVANWHDIPVFMIKLLPHFSDIKINKYTRKETLWQGCYQRFIEDHA
jgi:hypothetical protein